jgi:hypothetical protein
MIAVVYSGSKSAFWKISREGKTIAECTMPGINPCFGDEKYILQQLNKKNELINYAETIKKIYVFAAGASSVNKQIELANTLNLFFKNSKIIVNDDILGSGSNCAYFDGKKPLKNNYGMGYILGDEGSANYLGKILLKKYLTEKLPLDLKITFEEKYNIDRPLILERIYKKPNVQQYLSVFIDFYIENSKHKFIENLIDDAFDSYFKTYLLPTTLAYPNQPVHFVGTVAGTFADRLCLSAKKHQIEIITITKEPINNLVNYYSN